MHEVQACNDMTVEEALGHKDCLWGDWGPYGFCSKTCGGGQRDRTRQILQVRVGGGKECEGSQKETAQCNPELCNTASEADADCVWSLWSTWGDCSAKCGGGEMKRYRYVASSARNYGAACLPEDSREVVPCMTQPCGAQLFCVWTDWSAFTPCSSTCGSGTKKRSRTLGTSEVAPPGPVLDATYTLAIAGVTFSGTSALAMSASAGFAVVIGVVSLARRVRRSSGYGSVQE